MEAMRRLHIIIYIALTALLTVSCSKEERDPRQAILSQIGPDYTLLFVTNPTDLARSAGKDALEKLHKADSEMFMLLSSAEGLDKTVAVAVTYDNPVQNAFILCVTDGRKAADSLKKAGWSSTEDSCGEVFTRSGGAHSIIIDKQDIFWLLRASDAEKAVAVLRALKARAGALPEWLTGRVRQTADTAVFFSAAYIDSTHLAGTVHVKDTEARCTVHRFAADGAQIPVVDPAIMNSAAGLTATLDPKAQISVLFNPAGTPFGFMDLLDDVYLPKKLEDTLSELSGQFALSIVMKDPTADFMDFSNYRVALAGITADGRADVVAEGLCDYAASTGIPVSGRRLSFAGTDLLQAGAPTPSTVLIASPGFTPGGYAPAAGDILWLHVALPRGSSLLNMLGLDCGLAADGQMNSEQVSLTVDFPGSSQGFVANLIQIADNF